MLVAYNYKLSFYSKIFKTLKHAIGTWSVLLAHNPDHMANLFNAYKANINKIESLFLSMTAEQGLTQEPLQTTLKLLHFIKKERKRN